MQELFTGYICCLDIEHTQIQILNKNTFDEEKFTLSIPNEDLWKELGDIFLNQILNKTHVYMNFYCFGKVIQRYEILNDVNSPKPDSGR